MIEDYVPEILMSFPPRISDVVRPWVEISPDRVALVEAAGTWTYMQLASVIVDARAWLLDSGVRPGDRVMIVCENCRAFVAILLALAGIDAWPVLVSPRLSAREIDEIRDHCTLPAVLRMQRSMPNGMARPSRRSRIWAQSASAL
ncbi:MAG: hypothetical protein DMG96_31220 [Acidobacteria bacterium]|nr:MAG: hypothetical protein DMG96_31220 [Acidobacteriota bacterium]